MNFAKLRKPALFALIALVVGACAVWAAMSARGGSGKKPVAAVKWLGDEAEALRVARDKRLPVFVDFAAEWCAACHEMEESVFTDPAFIEAMSGFVPLRIDVTEDSAENERKLRKYGIVSLPTIVFLDPEGRVVPGARIDTVAPTSDFLATMSRVREAR